MTLEIEGTRLLDATLSCEKRILVHQGGTRSSKTYSIAQAFVIWMLTEAGKVFTISRKTMPALRRSAMRDFIAILRGRGLYHPDHHNKTESTYTWPETGTMVEFVPGDDPQKLRGPGRDRLWLNEANEFSAEDWLQLKVRTSGRATPAIVMDYNPSMIGKHWIYDEVLPREDCQLVKSTYLDNPFLPPEQVAEIERLKELDPFAWNVYGLGERGVHEATIYPRWTEEERFPDAIPYVYGMDFGYNDPSVIVRIGRRDREIPELHWDQMLYESHLTNQELIRRAKQLIPDALRANEGVPIYADAAEPDRIQEFYRAGFNIHPADKGKGSVRDGIDFIKRHRLFVTSSSTETIEEGYSYKWREDKDGNILDEPLDWMNHAMDAGRYAAKSHWGRPRQQGGAVTGFRGEGESAERETNGILVSIR